MDNETLHRHFIYEPSGALRRLGGRKDYPWRKAGKSGKYRITTFGNETLYLHRLVWQYHHGRAPSIVDHINGDTDDNRIENLRECSNAENQYNSKVKSNNKCGFKGVVFHPNCKHKCWQAKIVVGGKVRSLGYYTTPDSAGEAYLAAAAKIAGKFAYHLREVVAP